jgi:hypothetical protein
MKSGKGSFSAEVSAKAKSGARPAARTSLRGRARASGARRYADFGGHEAVGLLNALQKVTIWSYCTLISTNCETVIVLRFT